ncbi:hypothetical protein K438DRAFT_58545 [Mycena galopus ATCC 62051]|nr:hypothetical protein K438DRAFT_58545 [Mycena galopus ATCC 62051]
MRTMPGKSTQGEMPTSKQIQPVGNPVWNSGSTTWLAGRFHFLSRFKHPGTYFAMVYSHSVSFFYLLLRGYFTSTHSIISPLPSDLLYIHTTSTLHISPLSKSTGFTLHLEYSSHGENTPSLCFNLATHYQTYLAHIPHRPLLLSCLPPT